MNQQFWNVQPTATLIWCNTKKALCVAITDSLEKFKKKSFNRKNNVHWSKSWSYMGGEKDKTLAR